MLVVAVGCKGNAVLGVMWSRATVVKVRSSAGGGVLLYVRRCATCLSMS